MRRILYLVQPFVEHGGELHLGQLERYSCATEAEAAGRRLSANVPGVLVYMQEAGDVWFEPEVLAEIGRTPKIEY